MERTRLLAASVVLALCLTSCAGQTQNRHNAAIEPTSGSTLTIGSVSDNNSFDPAALEIGHRVQYWMPVYDTLLVIDEHGKPQPNLATEWSYNDEATVLSLTLREDVTFTDGTPFDAAAVRMNMEHLASGGGQNAYMTASIADYEIVDDHELRLELSAPDPGLIGYLGVVGGAMASPASLSADDLATHPIGCGPYLLDLERTSSGSQYIYVRNDDYWNAEAFPYDQLVIKPISDTIARLNALKSGQIDATVSVPSSTAEAESSGLQVHTTQVNWVGMIIADRDGDRVPALADVRVRRAINMAIDAEAVLEHVALGEGSVTDQIFNPSSAIFAPSLDGAYPYDLERAERLLAEAGYADGFSVRMPQIAAYDKILPLVDQALAALNISVEWVAESPDTAISALVSGEYPLFFLQLGSQSGWQDIQKSVLPSSPWNPFQAEDDELDILLNAAQHATGEEHRVAMQSVNAWLVDNAWFDPWYRENTVYLTDGDTDAVMQPQNVVPWIRGFAPSR